MDPEEGESGQLTWTWLPQGFKNSPTLFDEALSQDSDMYRKEHPEVTLLQYVDDLLLAVATQSECWKATETPLRTLEKLGYRVSSRKAQLCTPKATYLGYELSRRRRTLLTEYRLV